MLEYLQSNGFSNTADKFAQELQVAVPTKQQHQLLEKKWSNLLRLQKKVLSLEAQIEHLQQQDKQDNTQSQQQQQATFPESFAKHELLGHRGAITCLAVHPKFSLLASASEDTSIRFWDYETGANEKTLRGHTNIINCVTFDHQGKWLASCSADLTIRVWDAQAGECIKTFIGHEHNVSHIAFTPMNDHIVSASRDKTIKIWELSSGFCIKTLVGHDSWVRRVIVSEDGKVIASCSDDKVCNVTSSLLLKTIRLWSFLGEQLQVFHAHGHVIEHIAFAPIKVHEHVAQSLQQSNFVPKASSFLVSASRDKTLKIWNLQTGQCIQTLVGHDNWVRACFFHPAGTHVVSCSDDRSIKVWDYLTGYCVKTINDAHNHFVTCIQHNQSPHSNRKLIFASGAVDFSIKIWNCK